MKKEIRKKLKPAPMSKRIFAYLLDWYLGWVFTAIPVAYMWTITTQKTEINTDITLFAGNQAFLAGILGVLFGILYYFVFPLLNNGQTLGKKFTGIKIIDEKGGKLTTKALAIRQILGVMIAESSFILAGNYIAQMIGMLTIPEVGVFITYGMLALFVVSCIMVIKKQRAIHDIIAHSMVVETTTE